MSFHGYIISCGRCEIRMLVTGDHRYAKLCPECLKDYVLDSLDHLPPEQVVG